MSEIAIVQSNDDKEFTCPVHGDVTGCLIHLRATTGDLVTAGSFCMHCWVQSFLDADIPRLAVPILPVELGRPKRVRLTQDIRFVGKAGSEHDVIDSYCGLVTVTEPEGGIRSLPVLDEDDDNYEVIERWPVKGPAEKSAEPLAGDGFGPGYRINPGEGGRTGESRP